MDIVVIGTAVLAGVASILSPCVLPLLPGVMAYSTERNKVTPLAIVAGLALTYTVMGVAMAALGSLFFDYIDYVKIASGLLIMIMGLYLLLEVVENAVLRAWQHLPIARVGLPQAEEGGLFGGFLLGASLGVVWIPCVGPILGSIFIIVAQQGTMLYGGLLLFAYSLGLGVPMLALAYSSSYVSGKVRSLSKHTILVRKIAGVVLVAVGIYYLSGALGISLPLIS